MTGGAGITVLPEWWGRINPIAAYRAVHGAATNAAAVALLTRLENDERMPAAWQVFARHVRTPNDWATLIFEVLDAHAIAPRIRDAPAASERISTEYERMVGHAEALVAWFADAAESAPAHGAIEAAHDIHALARDVVAVCCRAAVFLREFPTPTLDRLDGLPNSRKQNAPALAFAVMVAGALDRLTGSPLYDVAAIITDIAFETGEPMTAEAVRKARTRDATRHHP